jgi:peptidoglycan hydrolase-like protein with peptidoglycan-binding domain
MSYTEAEYKASADAYSVPVPSVKTVMIVEATGEGYLPDGRPKILFEAHHFHARTGGVFTASHPTISQPDWEHAKRHYVGGAGEYDRLALARSLNENAALESASWGAGQVMGFNWRSLNFPSVQAFVAAMQTKAGQMDAMMRYCKVNNLLDEMRRFPDPQACRDFARGYNGSGAVDVYGPKLEEAYAVATGTPRTTLRKGMHGDDVWSLQMSLGIPADSDFGPATEAAVMAYQRSRGLFVDGIAGPRTLAALATQRAAA